MTEIHRGGCLCGAVRFAVSGPLRPVVYCHCGQCRRQTGLFYAATSAAVDAITIEEDGALRWHAASDTARRGFCAQCGSALFWQGDGESMRSILAGAMDEGAPLVAERHIFVADKPDWYELTDGLPQHGRGRTS